MPFPNCSTASGEHDFSVPNYCDGNSIRFNSCDHFEFIRDSLDNSATKCTRPLLGYTKDSQNPNIKARHYVILKTFRNSCKKQLSWSLQPFLFYMTSLYSIVDGCNSEIYRLIHSVLIQEMLHMVQAANILIATGGTPIVDNASFVPTYPTIGLPGCVHPNLTIYLDKLNMSQIQNYRSTKYNTCCSSILTIIQPHNFTMRLEIVLKP